MHTEQFHISAFQVPKSSVYDDGRPADRQSYTHEGYVKNGERMPRLLILNFVTLREDMWNFFRNDTSEIIQKILEIYSPMQSCFYRSMFVTNSCPADFLAHLQNRWKRCNIKNWLLAEWEKRKNSPEPLSSEVQLWSRQERKNFVVGLNIVQYNSELLFDYVKGALNFEGKCVLPCDDAALELFCQYLYAKDICNPELKQIYAKNTEALFQLGDLSRMFQISELNKSWSCYL